MHLSSKWQDPRIEKFDLTKLTPMGLHNDDRFYSRDLPSIQQNGLWYPILLYKVSLEWWNTKYVTWRSSSCYYQDPVVNDDNQIWAIKVGNNRWQVAKYLGYKTIDGIMFNNSDDCAKLGIWFRECNPLNNVLAPKYQGLFDYASVHNYNNS